MSPIQITILMSEQDLPRNTDVASDGTKPRQFQFLLTGQMPLHPGAEADHALQHDALANPDPANGVTSIAANTSQLLCLGDKYYRLPQCDHTQDDTYPHNEIKEVNTKFKCISDKQARNLCMVYRM